MMQTLKALQYDGELTISEGRSRTESEWKRRNVRWSELLRRFATTKRTEETSAEYAAMSRDKRVEIKDIGGFVGGAVKEGNRKAENIAFRQILCMDADYGSMVLWDDWTLLYGFAACIHSTHSHTPDKPRLRLLIPLQRPVQPDEYEAIARRVASWLDIEAFDDTTYQPNRLMFLPSTPKDGEYIFETLDGPWLDPDAVLAEYDDWKDMRQWPTSSRTTNERRQRVKKQSEPTEKPGVVGAFCRVYDIPAAIDAFLGDVYEPFGDRYTYTGGTTSGGLVVYDGGAFAYSHHDSDPTGGRLCNAFDLVRIHLYGERDKDVESDIPPHKRPSFEAMKKLCGERPEVLAELDARIHETARDEFSETDDDLGRYDRDYTEQGNAVQFSDMFRGQLCYHKNLGWLFWDGMRWLTDAKAEAILLGMRFADTLLEAAMRLSQIAGDDKIAKAQAEAAFKWAKASRGKQKIENMLSLARSLLDEPDIETFDADPWLLNTPAGIVDLRTGEIGPHDPLAFCTMICSVEPEPWDPTKASLWAGFLKQMTNDSAPYARYLQMVAGMAAIGYVYEASMLIPYGPGRNGKSTLVGVWLVVFGDYAGTIRPELLLSQGNGKEAFGMEQVRGKRLVVAAETDEGAKLSVSIMKRLTSDDPISANPKGKDPFTFNPTHTLVLHTNHLPRLRSLDEGLKRRIAVAPFDKVIPPQNVIAAFGKRLVEQEGGQILGWIIEGAKMFYEAGCKLEKPAEVLQATAEYFDSEDWFHAFLEEKCEIDPSYSERAGELYACYRAWAELNGEYVRRGNEFSKELEKRGFEKRKGMTGATRFGLRIKTDEMIL